MWFDGRLVRKDDVFTDPELERAFLVENLGRR